MNDKKNMTEQEKRIWKALNKYGVYTEADLDRELKKLKPLNIGIMTQRPKTKVVAE